MSLVLILWQDKNKRIVLGPSILYLSISWRQTAWKAIVGTGKRAVLINYVVFTPSKKIEVGVTKWTTINLWVKYMKRDAFKYLNSKIVFMDQSIGVQEFWRRRQFTLSSRTIMDAGMTPFILLKLYLPRMPWLSTRCSQFRNYMSIHSSN